MYSPDFLNQLQEYLNSRATVPFQTWLANKNNPTPTPPTTAPTTPTATSTPVVQAPVTTTPEAPTHPRGLDSILNAMMPPAYFNMMQKSPRFQKAMTNFKDKITAGFDDRLADRFGGRGGNPHNPADVIPPTNAAPTSGPTPPPGYRPGIDPEWNYGFAAPVKYEEPAGGNVNKKATGGTVSTGNAVADKAVAEGNQKVINNLEASAMYAAQDNAANGTPIPEGLKQFLPNGGGTVVDLNKLVDIANGKASTGSSGSGGTNGQYTNFWDRFNGGGPGAGYTSPIDWINGGGMGGSYANPGTNIRGLGAVVNDLQQGGISALARDLVNGGGLGASGDNFRGGQRAIIMNALGINPAGEKKSIFNFVPEASPELEAQWAANQRYGWKPEKDKHKFSLNNLFGTGGTEGTAATGESTGGIIRFAEGGIMDIPDPAAQAQPPMGNEKDLISSAIAAIKGQVEDPRPILGAFLAKYGEEALRNLVDKVESGDVDQTAARSGGLLKGPGDGMDDRIPAKAENGHDVLLANSEYIVPADVISALGNGSSDAGAEHMDKMLERVRTAAHGKSTQQKKVSADKVLPA